MDISTMALLAPNADHDELDTLSVGANSDVFYASSSPVAVISAPQPQTLRRSSRPRQYTGSVSVTATSNLQPRKRTLSTSALENGTDKAVQKKMKMDEKKAQTGLINKKRDARDQARRQWLYCHREVIEPLLPMGSSFFEQLEKDLLAGRPPGTTISFVPSHGLYEQPGLIQGGQMKDYQLEGLSFLVTMYNNGMNCILGDEMGLGKTLQTLSLFAHIKEKSPGLHDPHLVICPLSVLSSWETEAARWLPSLRVIRFHGPASERDRLKHSLRGDRDFDIMLTTYDAYSIDDSWFKSFRWTYCVLDEGHKIKNSDTNLSQKIQGIGSLHRLILTGTPVQNNLLELWGLLHWLFPTVFTAATERLFKESFDLSRGSYEIPFLNAAKKLVSTIMLRRTKAVVAGDDVPPRDELTVFIPLTEAQRFWTYRLLTKMDTPDLKKIFAESEPVKKETFKDEDLWGREILADVENQLVPQTQSSQAAEGSQWKKLMNLLMQLRKVCDHPYLLPNAEPEPYDIAEHIVSASSKLIAIDKILADILPKGERVLIFSQWTGMLDILEDLMVLRSIPFARLDGSTSRPRRALDIKLFQQEVSPYQVFLISTKAGGLGINLTKATAVIMCDSDWNPQNDLQAIARAHRLGQTKVVKVYRLICQGSVEDQMLDRIRRKLFLSVKIMGSDNPSSSDKTTLGSSELMDILRKGSSALSQSERGMNLERFLQANVSDILQESRSLESKRDAKIKVELKDESEGTPDAQLLLDAEEEERRLLSGVAQVQSRLFEGKLVHKNNQSNTEIAREWQAMQKRTHVNRTISVGGMTYIVAPTSPQQVHKEHPKPVKKSKAKYDSEEWCIYCRDGGELVICPSCPRVFHARCQGLSPAEVRRPMVYCGQHMCGGCHRKTSDCGGMLFRCRTCPQAFCEDCLPPGDIDAIGDVLPEFQLLGYGSSPSAYYIRCHDCREDFSANPESQYWREWMAEIRQAEKKWAKMIAHGH
ncbi:putative global transcription activator SNF2L1 [Hypsizygus marmoreus]|uniref:Global transcription activator SNF2L1 n=1 Tax=Hypsizygus marmoreus TaxID=39966 RepID=A0A369JC94_HYPMA|nr:putative global transcription activator SNF2L1 [Hypsizygus marmoreus]